MTQIVLGVAGAYVGSFFGNPALGFAIGSAIGGALEGTPGQKITGPRLNELTVQSSTLGTMIPILYGRYRCAGNLIWATDIKETVTRKKSGGKGGGPKVKTTTYSYSVDMAVALGRGELLGITRVWANGKLIYSHSGNADAQSLAVSNQSGRNFKFYPGSETQLPDPTIETALGIGNVPAYRGTAYVVFNDLQLAEYGNAIPNLTFEVIASGEVAEHRRIAYNGPTGVQFYTQLYTDRPSPFISSVGNVARVLSDLDGKVYLFDLNGNYIGIDKRAASEEPIGYWTGIPPRRYLGGFPFYAIGLGSLFNAGARLEVEVMGTVPYRLDVSGPLPGNERFMNYAMAPDNEHIAIFTATAGAPADTADRYYILQFVLDDTELVRTGIIDPPSADLWVSTGYVRPCLENDLLHIWSANCASNDLVLFSIDDGNVLIEEHRFHEELAVPGVTDFFATPSCLAQNGICYVVAGQSFLIFTRIASYDFGTTQLSSIVTSIAQQCDLSPDQIDVSEMTDLVSGYAVTRQSTGRAAMQQLLTAYFYDSQESDGKIRFIKRGQDAVATINFDDLGAIDFGADPAEPFPLQRMQEVDLPRSLSVSYINVDGDYQVGTEVSQRLITSSVNDEAVQLAIVMDTDQAAQIADVLMYSGWTARSARSLSTTRKFSRLDPSDVVLVEYPRGKFNRVRLLKDSYSGSRLDFDCVMDDADAYISNASGATIGPTQETLEALSPTIVVPLDIPLLRDQDDNAGYYAALVQVTNNWNGATLYRSPDDVSYAEVGSVETSAISGVCLGTLGNFLGGYIFDEVNYIDVRIVEGELSSTTKDNLLLDLTLNVCAIGSELLQFEKATLQSVNTYRLSGLLRGLQGTEQYMPAHEDSERFVLLEGDGLLRPNDGMALINQKQYLKGVTFGQSLDDALATSFTNTGAGLKPLSPVHAGGGRNAALDIIFKWVRRTRWTAVMKDGVDAPLAETVEAYEVDIYTTSGFVTVVRTLTSTTPTATYTAAQQTADFGATQATCYAIIYQMSSTIGRGFGRRITI